MSNLSFVRHVGDGVNRQFTLSTAGTNIGYFRTEDIHAYVNDEEVTFVINPASPHLVVLDDAPPLGADVLLRREMPVETPYANFERGNNFGHRQVNNSFLQQLYLTQEMLDGFAPEGYYLKQELNMGVHKVVNMQRASAAGEAVEFTQWDERNLVQDDRLLSLEQSLTAGNLVYRRVTFTATQGQTEFNPNAVFGGILSLYVNGVNQIAGEAYESVDGRLIRTVPLDEGDRVVAVIGQEPKFVEPEQTDFRYVRYSFFATGGETTYVLPADAKQVMSLYLNGSHQTISSAFEYSTTTHTVTFAEALEGGDEVVLYAGSEPAVEGDASNLPVTSTDGSETNTLRSWMQKFIDFGKNTVRSLKSTVARPLDAMLSDQVNILDFGAVEGQDSSSAILSAYAALQDGETLYVPAGDFHFQGATDSTFLTWDKSNCKLIMDGYFVPIANSDGHMPSTIINITGSDNTLQVNLANDNNVTQELPTPTSENAGNGVYLRGYRNKVMFSNVFNFKAPYRLGGYSNEVNYSVGTVQQVANIGWSNDIAVIYFCVNGAFRFNKGGVHDVNTPRGVTFDNHPLRESSTARTGIAIDAYSERCIVEGNEVGEGFQVGIHSEGKGIRGNTIVRNTVHTQQRNALNLAAGYLVAEFNILYPVLNINKTGNTALIGQIGSLQSNAVVRYNYLIGEDGTTTPTTEAMHVLAGHSPDIYGNDFEGHYALLLNASAGRRPRFSRNRHITGHALQAFSYSKHASGAVENRLMLNDNVLRVLNQAGTCSSGGKMTAKGNVIYLVEGYTPATWKGYFVVSGNQADSGQDPNLARFIFTDNEVYYVGTTAIAGNTFFVRSDSVSVGIPRGSFSCNLFDSSIAFRLIEGANIDPANWAVFGNSTDSIV